MAQVLMQARSSSSGALISWVSVTPDFAGDDFPGPGDPQEIAIVGQGVGGVGALSSFTFTTDAQVVGSNTPTYAEMSPSPLAVDCGTVQAGRTVFCRLVLNGLSNGTPLVKAKLRYSLNEGDDWSDFDTPPSVVTGITAQTQLIVYEAAFVVSEATPFMVRAEWQASPVATNWTISTSDSNGTLHVTVGPVI